MTTQTKKKRTKKTKTATPKAPTEKHLTDAEMAKMDNLHLKIKLEDVNLISAKKDCIIMEQTIKIAQYEKEALERQLSQLKTNVRNVLESKERIRKENADFNKQLAERYELEGAWGFNPETGLIIQD